ncbi:hypothetical protein Aeh1gORF131c [Aeromonas phage Aeh1]|uniref:Uncharacterized protein n=1 Tax=Aeromonas phage Aeh1 TaxID=2880362 RepID=Q76YX4_9CAUD|nr:hypothetical protein Aeh1p117 [Aeromonas phage Aeh1]AAQ17772.1 hypothetical protein Aeh1gORF131c [Aeromonas phage Aeh1]
MIIHQNGRYSICDTDKSISCLNWTFCVDGFAKHSYGTKDCPSLCTAIRDYRKHLVEEIKYSKEKVDYHAKRDMMLSQELEQLEKEHDFS